MAETTQANTTEQPEQSVQSTFWSLPSVSKIANPPRVQATCELTMKLEREQTTPGGSKGSQVAYSHFGNLTVYQVQANCELTMKLNSQIWRGVTARFLPVWNQSRGVFPRVGIWITRLSSPGVVSYLVSWARTHVSQKGAFLRVCIRNEGWSNW